MYKKEKLEIYSDICNRLETGRRIKRNEKLIVVWCKVCKRPRLIIKSLCPGCLEKGVIVFDNEYQPIKELLKK